MLLLLPGVKASYSQKIKPGDLFLNIKGGLTASYLFGKEEHYADSGYDIPEYDQQLRLGFLAGMNFIQMITTRLYYSGGFQFNLRKMTFNYKIEPKQSHYINNYDPLAEETKTYRDLTCPILLGINFNRFNMQGGFEVSVLRYIYTELYAVSGRKINMYGGLEYNINIFPAISASYLISEKSNIYVFAGIEKQLLYPWCFGNAGLSVSFGLQEKPGSYYKYCKPPG